MSQSSLFDSAAERLDELTDLSRLESRGTLRIVLKKAGFDPRSVTASDFGVVIEKLLPAELVARGIEDADEVSRSVVAALASAAISDPADAQETPDTIFRRLSS